LSLISQYENVFDRPTPAVGKTNVEIIPVPMRDLLGGPQTAAKFNGDGELDFGTDQPLYALEFVGTIGVLFKAEHTGNDAVLISYGGEFIRYSLYFCN